MVNGFLTYGNGFQQNNILDTKVPEINYAVIKEKIFCYKY